MTDIVYTDRVTHRIGDPLPATGDLTDENEAAITIAAADGGEAIEVV